MDSPLCRGEWQAYVKAGENVNRMWNPLVSPSTVYRERVSECKGMQNGHDKISSIKLLKEIKLNVWLCLLIWK